jgi:PKD repeat protein
MSLRRGPKALLTLIALLGLMQIPAGCAKGIVGPKTAPTADFSATPTSGSTPLDVSFTDRSAPGTSEITSVRWSFGDNATSTLRNPGHTYATPGTYTVSLTVTSADGSDTVTKTDYITVLSSVPTPPTAAFVGTPTAGPPGLLVQFTDQSTQGSALISSWLWSFGDGGTSALKNPSHVYAADGTYTVTLTVTTALGSDVATKTGYITIAPGPPIAAFSAAPTTGITPLTVNFTDQSTAGGVPITSWAWSFGDTTTSRAQSPSHTYTKAGTYTVSLTVTNANGSDIETKTNIIVATQGPIPPTAAFSGTPTAGAAPLTVNFTDQSTAGTSPITGRLWDFGDGSPASAATNPSHTYSAVGNYTVALTVFSTSGQNTATKNGYIQVVAAPVAPTVDFSASPTTGIVPLPVQFTDLSANGGSTITSWFWSFGDGGTSTLQNPTHTYAAEGTYTVVLAATNSVGPGTTTKTNFITATHAPVAPTAAFSGTPTSGNAPLTVQFTDLSTPGSAPITSRLWDFGDGNTSTVANPSHVYAVPGTYTVVLSVSTADGENTANKGSYIQVLTPPVAPTAEFAGSPTSGFAPLTVNFTDLSTNGGATITSWSWTFGDGGTSTSQNPSHIYAVPGTYSVSLTATNSVGPGSATKTNYITASVVPVPPTAAFSGTPTSGDAPLTVQFTDESTAGTSPITTRLWNFGDGDTSSAQNPSHIYTVPGTYTVVLSVSTAVGDNTANKGSYIQVLTPPVAPTAEFAGSPTSGFAPLTVNFTDLSTNGGRTITSWSWTFGDGGTSTSQNPSHIYAAPGTYSVSLTATNSVGPGSATKTNYITASVVPVPPIAAFSGTPTSGDAPLTVQFTDESTAGTSPITTRLWNFGDGATSTVQNPSHIYTVPGTYTVVLSVSTADGDNTATKGSYIQVLTPPVAPTAEFGGSPTSGFAPLTVNFTDLSTNGGATITSWSWTFGDGGTSTSQNPSHIYAAPGTYTVSLTATNSVGPGSTTKTNYITASVVPVPPTAAFSGTPTSGDAPLTVQFTDESAAGTSPITGRLWDFGDASTSTAQNPSHIYTTPGTYTVVLSVSTADGDNTVTKGSYIQVLTPPVAPTAEFSGTPTTGFAPLTVNFTDLSTNGGRTITSWSWTFGDGGTSTSQNPSHIYAAPGTYSVSLTATNSVGPGSNTKTNYITVVPVLPTAAFSGTPTSGDAPLTVQFTDESTAGTFPITSRLWNFGDGDTSSATSPSHVYTTPGTYGVALTVSTAAGDNTATKLSYVLVSTPPTPPTAAFTGTPTTGFVPLTVNFTDQSTPGTATITSWSWTFGDGGTSAAQNPSHIYAVPGAYSVSLTATNSVGPGSTTKTNYITASVVPVPPTAAFSGTPTSGDAPLTVQFTDESTAGTSPITARLWDFGDGGTSTAQNPSHIYTVPGTYTVVLSVSTADGENTANKGSYIQVLTPPVAPTAEFAGSPTTGFAPLTVNFTDLSTNGGATITSWSWTFGDGGTSTAQNPSHIYAAPGTYSVSLTATNSVGPGSVTKTNYITASIVPVPPTAAFSGTPTSGDAPLTVQFTDESTAGTSPITTRLWNFGDGDTSSAANPSHIYTVPGTYSVVLSVSTAVGDNTANKGSYIQVLTPPVAPTAEFAGSPTSGFAPLTVNFTDLSTNGGRTITSWSWTFGDGGTSTSQNPSHIYAAPGAYSVSLTATNSVGPGSTTKTNYITASVVPVPPTAAFSGTPTSGDAPLTVQFTDESAAGTSPITGRLWDFGDASTSTAQNPSHIYTVPGTYTVVLSVSTADGDNTATKGSYIQALTPPVAPTAALSGTPTTGFAPLTVNFTDLSANGGAAIASWSWTFGDGGTSTAQNPSHIYTVPGTYSVSLTATNSVGPGSTTSTNYITVAAVPPTAAFSGTPTSGDAPLTVQFTDESTAGTSPITSRLWDFGDANTSTAQNPSHIYTTPGTYTVALTVSTTAGDNTATKTSYVLVSTPPTPPTGAFTGTPTTGFVPLTVNFTDQSTPGTATITSWSWTFGDGGTSTAQNPSHIYSVPGIYDVSLTATNSVGPGTTTKTGYVTASVVPVPPTAAFSGTPTSGDAPLTVQFTDESTAGTSPITGRLWNFGDGDSSSVANPSHIYTTPGSYTVVLIVSTAAGEDNEGKASYIQVLVPPVAPTAEFSGTPTTGFAPLTVNFTDLSTNGGATITSWSWTFGDGGTSTSQNPSHIYAAPGAYTVSLTATNSVGPGSTTKTNYITASVVPVPPIAAFSGTPTSGDAPLTVQFTDESTAGTSPITARLWNFGDGDTSSAANPSHIYTVPGTYTVVLSVSTAVGDNTANKGSYIQVLTPPVAPTAEFAGSPTTGFAPLTVNFTDLSTNGGATITSWSWTFGDGGTSTSQNPSHIYAAPGAYSVSLTATNSVGPGSTTKTNYITAAVVPVPPTAAFSGTPTSGDAPLTVQFTDESTAGTSPITARLWNFGDGDTSSAANPSHIYTVPGTYTVVLSVSTAVGDNTANKGSYIQVLTPPVAPTAEFAGSPTTGFAPLTVNFTDLSTNGGATITSWSWTFGDGGTSTSQNPSHIYAAPGTYSVSLTATNSVGPGSTTKTNYITAAVVPVPPTAAFSGTPTSGDAPLTVQFTDESTAGTSPITGRLWDFGDGSTSIATNPSHVYTVPGSYTVALTVSTLVGDNTATKGSYIQALTPPVSPTAEFSGTPTSGDAPLTVNFTDESANGGATITSWSWTFGDGGTSTSQNPSHVYAAPGTYSVSLTATNSVGPGGTTKTNYISVAPTPVAPTAAFSGTPTSGNAPLSVDFTDQSTPGTQAITSWAWTFGDGGTSTAQNPSHSYTAPGSYTVSLRVASSVGPDSTTKAGYITANAVPPTAEFSGTPTSGFAPLTVSFTDQSTPGTATITSWAWTFGDGGTSTLQNPTHIYSAPGTYTVSLTATSSAGPGSTTKTGYITAAVVPVPPTAAFSGTPTSGDAPLTVQLTDESAPGTSSITAWSWNFGDGGTSTSTSPSHIYTVPGTYTVELTVSTADGTDSETKASYVQVSTPPVAPTVEFSGAPTGGDAPLTVQFTDESTNGGATITSWSWTFGDGGTSTAQNPGHIYTLPGTYDVSLTATNSAGPGSATKTNYIVVSPTPVAPTAAFTGTPTSGNAPLTVNFTDESTNGTATITSWSWTFGDGGTSTAQNPSHDYTAPGSYTVSLRVASSVGPDSTTKAGYITANAVPPTAAFSGTPTSGDAPLTVQFTDESTPGTATITSWSWTFGDGGTSTAQNPSHSYTSPGSYTVSLRVANSVGPDSTTKVGYIAAIAVPPTAAFSGTPTSGGAPLTVQFTDQSTAGSSSITSHLWDFGDGNTSTETSPSHVYADSGSYNVALTVSTADGSDSENKAAYIHVSNPPTVDFSASPVSGFSPMSVQFTDESTNGGSPITSWAWVFGDGGTSTAQNPTRLYTVPGTYTVSLTATNVAGPGLGTKIDLISVGPPKVPPTAAFSGTPTSGDAPLTVQFTDESTPGSASITGRLWDFGDGGTSTATNPSHLYITPGSYTVVLDVVTDDGEGKEDKASYIEVLTPLTAPVVDFSADSTLGIAPLSVHFTDLSTGGGATITSWAWDFGDGGTSTLQNPSHTFAAGTYTVSLTATNSVGPGSATKTNYITVAPPPVPPTAAFSGTPTGGDAPLTVQFTDESTAGSSPITARTWHFGDGDSSTATNPSHTYTVPGTYTVALGVSTAVGENTENKGSYIQVLTPPTAPVADFSADSTLGIAPLSVHFTDLSTNGGATITSWAWDFGDGGASTLRNPSHTFAAGTYTVSLTATNSVGPGSATKTNYITVAPAPVPPTAAFSGTPTSGDAPLTVQFTDESTAGSSPITARTWHFGDGDSSTATNPSHTYTVPGSYTVVLGVSTADGEDTADKAAYIQVSVPPVAPTADFSADVTTGAAPLQVQFTDLSATGGAAITSWSWDFGDSTTSSEQSPLHTFDAAGIYTVTLTATNSAGPGSVTKTDYITVTSSQASGTAPIVGER